MSDITIRKIPSCIVYTAEYDVPGVDSFFDEETGDNALYDLQYLMEAENPDVHVPDIPDDYNFFFYPLEKNPDGTIHVIYCDMVDKAGTDSPSGAYRFTEIPEIQAAVLMHKGAFDTIDKGFALVQQWVKDNGYEICGPGRISAVHGPWDREDPNEYVNELQIPVR